LRLGAIERGLTATTIDPNPSTIPIIGTGLANRHPRSRVLSDHRVRQPSDHRERLWDRARKNRATPSAIFFQKKKAI
jgi:hypothetical protein